MAKRKLAAAETLAATHLGAEAISQAHACMIAAVRSLAVNEAAEDSVPPARLLYEILVPRGSLDLQQAALISRADGLAKAYADITQPVSPNTVQAVLGDARGLLEQVSQGAGE